MQLPRPQSLAITFSGISELIINKSGSERSAGKGEKKPSLPFSFPSFPVHAPVTDPGVGPALPPLFLDQTSSPGLRFKTH